MSRGAKESGEDCMDWCNGDAWGHTGVWVLMGANESGEDGMHGCKRAGGGGCRMVLRRNGTCLHHRMVGGSLHPLSPPLPPLHLFAAAYNPQYLSDPLLQPATRPRSSCRAGALYHTSVYQPGISRQHCNTLLPLLIPALPPSRRRVGAQRSWGCLIRHLQAALQLLQRCNALLHSYY